MTRRQIVASDVRLDRRDTGWTLSCAVSAPGLDVPDRFYYTVERAPADTCELTANPFLPPLLLLGAHTSRDLLIDGPVSQELLDHVPAVLALWHKWDPTSQMIDVTTAPASPGRRASAAATFFSGGVDSFYSVASNDYRYRSCADPRFVRFLIFCVGFDIPIDDPRREEYVRSHVERAADDLRKELVVARTNAREFVASLSWAYHGYGPCLGGVGLACGAIADTIYVPSGYAYQQFYDEGANSSHPFVDPLWSTASVDIVHSGAEATRAQKIARLAHSPTALAHLRVCWQNIDGAYNCCRCEKCLRTMIEFELCGVLNRMEAFPLPLTADALRALRIHPHLFGFWQESLGRARQSNTDEALCDAIAEALTRARFEHSYAGRGMQMFVSRPLSSIGFTPARLKQIDEALLQGRGVQTFRKLRWLLRS
jgi:hypothetical protein